MKTTHVKAFGTQAPEANLKEMNIERREVAPTDV